MRESIAITLRRRSWLLLFVIVSLVYFCSCGGTAKTGSSVDKNKPDIGTLSTGEKLNIPPGHLPPPGLCRIWIPGTPPGQQSPAGDCEELKSRVPVGAWLVHRDANNPERLEVSVYHKKRPSVVVVVRYFDVPSGRFLGSAIP